MIAKTFAMQKPPVLSDRGFFSALLYVFHCAALKDCARFPRVLGVLPLSGKRPRNGSSLADAVIQDTQAGRIYARIFALDWLSKKPSGRWCAYPSIVLPGSCARMMATNINTHPIASRAEGT